MTQIHNYSVKKRFLNVLQKRYKGPVFCRLEEFDPLQNVDTIIANYKSLEQKNFSY